MTQIQWFPLLPLSLVLSCTTFSGAETPELATRLRRPVALVQVQQGQRLLVANRESGSISVIDLPRRRVIGETVVGTQLSDLAVSPRDNLVLATDKAEHRLLLLEYRDGKVTRRGQVPVGRFPVRVTFNNRGDLAIVASSWSHLLTLVRLPLDSSQVPQQISLPFAPRAQLALPDGQTLLVADAFGGQLGIVDLLHRRLSHVHDLPAHNLRGLALSADRRHLLVTHQVLNPLARTTANDVFWGLLMANNIWRLPLSDVLDKRAPLVRRGRAIPLGQAGQAAGDPADVHVLDNDSFVVALSGIHQLGIGHHDRIGISRVPTGRGPRRLVVDRDRRQALVTATFDDCVTLVDLDTARHITDISLGPRPTDGDYERGEQLFFDATLSRDGWMSCHSCHVDGHSNGQLNDNLGDAGYGAPKRVLSLLGTVDTGPWAWNGQVHSLRDQVLQSVTTTMRGPKPSARQARDLVAFLRGLGDSAPGLKPKTPVQQQSVQRGGRLFQRFNCTRCHPAPYYTSYGGYNVGLKDEVGYREFNPPSLRGVAQRRRLFHDNRARSLEEVFARFRHRLPRELTKRELADLVSFLRSL